MAILIVAMMHVLHQSDQLWINDCEYDGLLILQQFLEPGLQGVLLLQVLQLLLLSRVYAAYQVRIGFGRGLASSAFAAGRNEILELLRELLERDVLGSTLPEISFGRRDRWLSILACCRIAWTLFACWLSSILRGRLCESTIGGRG